MKLLYDHNYAPAPDHERKSNMVKKKLRIGKGSICFVIVKQLRPSDDVEKSNVNKQNDQRMADLISTVKEEQTRRGKNFMAVHFMSPAFSGIDLWCVKRFINVVREGPEEDLFADSAHAPLPRKTINVAI